MGLFMRMDSGMKNNYEGTATPVKMLVGGLTLLVNSASAVFGAGKSASGFCEYQLRVPCKRVRA